MIGMDVPVFDILNGFGMLGAGSHVLGALSTFFARLRPFILHSDFCPFLECLAGTPLFAGMDKLMADLEQKAGARGEGLGARRKKFAIFPAALEFPQEPTASVHEHHSPSKRLVGGSVSPNPCVDFISFDLELEKLVKQRIKEQGLLDSGKPLLPLEDSVLGQLEGPRHCVQGHSLCPGLDHMDDGADGFFDPGQKGVCRFREAFSAGLAPVDPLSMVLGGVEGRAHHIFALAAGTGDCKQFHDRCLIVSAGCNQR